MHLWPRRLSPLFSFGANFLIWKKVYAFSPKISYLLLANPTVYLSEGLRSTLLDEQHYLPLYICIGMAIFFITFFIGVLAHGVKKRLDPV